MKKQLLGLGSVLIFAPLLVAAQTALPSAGLTPESPFYFLDRFNEAIQEFFTFNPEAKARLEISFAAERVAEIKVMLETKGVNAKGIEVAENRLKTHLADAAAVVADQKNKGKDVSELAKELDDEFEAPKAALDKAFKDEKKDLENQEKELKIKLENAAKSDKDAALAQSFLKELGDIAAQKELLDTKKDDNEKALEEEGEKIKDEMDVKTSAEKAIKEAEEAKQEILDEANGEGVDISAVSFGTFDNLLSQAKELFDKENYVGARQLAKQAEKSLDAVEKDVENLKESKENENENQNESSDQERGRELKSGEEKSKKSEEKLNKERSKAEEEDIKKTEENEERGQGSNVSRAPQNWTVKFENGRFNPSEIKIKKGDTVTFVNDGSTPVWPASNPHPIHTDYAGFDALKGLNGGETYSFTFDKTGDWKYHNHLNPSVGGVIDVEE